MYKFFYPSKKNVQVFKISNFLTFFFLITFLKYKYTLHTFNNKKISTCHLSSCKNYCLSVIKLIDLEIQN